MLPIIDRRLNEHHKSAVNRERFLRRYKEHVRKAVQDMVGERTITDMDQGGSVSIPTKDVSEPRLRHGAGGDHETVYPGNRKFSTGDVIERPQGGDGLGGPGSGSGDGVDGFVFSLSREEFLKIFFDDLELPRLLHTSLGSLVKHKWTRAGYVTEGAPCNLAVLRTLRNSIGRRIALTGSLTEQRDELQARLDDPETWGLLSPAALTELLCELARVKARAADLPFLEELDLRYRHRVATPTPVARAVMFCLMDVSASMDEAKKDLAKRFFVLLHLFLTHQYEQVELVFIRHTEDADEVSEDVFFNDPKNGGTLVLSALTLAHEIAVKRYPSATWNLYMAQASDGDAFGSDAGKSAGFLATTLLSLVRHFAYIEIHTPHEAHFNSLWAAYKVISHPAFAMKYVSERGEIYPVFRQLFQKQHQK